MSDTVKNRIMAAVLIIGLGVILTIIVVKGNRGDEENLAALEEVVAIIGESQDAACLTGNSARLSQFSEANRDAAEARELAGQEHDPEISAIWKRRAVRKEELAESILASAKLRGDLLDPNQPIVDCMP